MQLLYRGIAYELNNQSAPAAADHPDQREVRLVYRGNAYTPHMRPQLGPNTELADDTSTTLMYRGHRYERITSVLREKARSLATSRPDWQLSSQI